MVFVGHRLVAWSGRHVGLIFLLLGGCLNSSLATTRDTITVDGVALRLDLDVQKPAVRGPRARRVPLGPS